MQDLERNRVLPPGGGDVLGAVKAARDPALPAVADALLGTVRLELDGTRAPLFDGLATPTSVVSRVDREDAGRRDGLAGSRRDPAAGGSRCVCRSTDARHRSLGAGHGDRSRGSRPCHRRFLEPPGDGARPGAGARQCLAPVRQLGNACAAHREVPRARAPRRTRRSRFSATPCCCSWPPSRWLVHAAAVAAVGVADRPRQISRPHDRLRARTSRRPGRVRQWATSCARSERRKPPVTATASRSYANDTSADIRAAATFASTHARAETATVSAALVVHRAVRRPGRARRSADG